MFFSRNRKLVMVDGKMDGATPRTIVEENLLDVEEGWRLWWRFTFQQENHSKHTARDKIKLFR